MKWPHDLGMHPVEEVSRHIALASLEEAGSARDRLNDPSDSEALHDFRVALRRLRSCLRAYTPHLKGCAPRRTRRRISTLARATGESRDLEVQAAWLAELENQPGGKIRPGIEALKERLAGRKADADQATQDATGKEFARLRRRLRSSLAQYTVRVRADRFVPRTPAGRVAARLATEWAVDLRGKFAAPDVFSHGGQAHAARIALKRFRYLMEPYAPGLGGGEELIARLSNLQGVLGELNDMRQLGGELASALYDAADSGEQVSLDSREGHAATGTKPGPARSAALEALLALVGAWRARRDRMLQRARADWLNGQADELFIRVAALATSLEHLSGLPVEMERKYLLSSLPPEVRGAPVEQIEQGWLPGSHIAERFRRVHAGGRIQCYRTLKLGGGWRRIELEEEISEELFKSIWPLTVGRRVQKRRYRLENGDGTWEVDEFTDRQLVLAEVELPGGDEGVEPPEWLQPFVVREVTEEPEFLGVQLGR